LRRGSAPLGGGQVHLISPGKAPLLHLPTLHFTSPQRITTIHGIATSTKLPAQMTTRLATSAKNVLKSFLPPSRIQIYSDPARGNTGSPGYGICLVAESSSGVLYTAERTCPETPTEDTTPEAIAEQCAQSLLIEIAQGGCVDSFAAPLVTICCAALNGNKGDVGRIVLGGGCAESETWFNVVRDLKLFFGVEGRFEPQTDRIGLLCRWVGTGWVNSARGTN
jgi:RNA 3'-terminal phosphate cyclase-like protein